ncbi:uncharacterized protein CELE_Y38H6C.15 [Caenorhabditis elegans]|uniref:Uncharacterized protein n=1 Tax=Caenorhabditis elegans TaxID=6239 RepID=Q9XX46_CAEEL|nr:Uncharacterized protein CELE_Y38H6C.15 [Caenorhabditis elegans]CAA20993.1 Uncharacterized protein CELE_Y38H6C.15 [Caenorhabditis elegans]|eukprot:NP_507958.1 Uncharacterized protein CELE_Y38H6C.15 [Caenorhabditis elegans]
MDYIQLMFISITFSIGFLIMICAGKKKQKSTKPVVESTSASSSVKNGANAAPDCPVPPPGLRSVGKDTQDPNMPPNKEDKKPESKKSAEKLSKKSDKTKKKTTVSSEDKPEKPEKLTEEEKPKEKEKAKEKTVPVQSKLREGDKNAVVTDPIVTPETDEYPTLEEDGDKKTEKKTFKKDKTDKKK